MPRVVRPRDLEVTGPRAIGVATYPPGATFGPRRMTEYEFIWMVEGDAEFTMDGRTVPMPEDSVGLCRPGTTDFFRWDRRRPTRQAYFHFGAPALPRAWPTATTWPIVREIAEPDDVLRTLFRHMLTWSGRVDATLARLTIAHMLASYVTGQTAANGVPPPVLPDAVERATAWMHARLEADASEPIDLADLADAAGVTREHLCRLFAAATGRGPMETVRAARLDRAATLIARSNLPLKAIAAACGFSSAFHLSRRFAEAHGLPPRDVRRRVQRGLLPPQPLLLSVRRADPNVR